MGYTHYFRGQATRSPELYNIWSMKGKLVLYSPNRKLPRRHADGSNKYDTRGDFLMIRGFHYELWYIGREVNRLCYGMLRIRPNPTINKKFKPIINSIQGTTRYRHQVSRMVRGLWGNAREFGKI